MAKTSLFLENKHIFRGFVPWITVLQRKRIENLADLGYNLFDLIFYLLKGEVLWKRLR